jgi:hypothetical protein
MHSGTEGEQHRWKRYVSRYRLRKWDTIGRLTKGIHKQAEFKELFPDSYGKNGECGRFPHDKMQENLPVRFAVRKVYQETTMEVFSWISGGKMLFSGKGTGCICQPSVSLCVI